VKLKIKHSGQRRLLKLFIYDRKLVRLSLESILGQSQCLQVRLQPTYA